MKRLGPLLLVVGCGYQPIYASGSQERLCVKAVEPKIADFGAVDAALNGARGELQRAGALASRPTAPCLVIELLSVAEVATGLRAEAAEGQREQPRGSGSAVSVTGRGWIEESGRDVSRDTGDMTRDSHGSAAFSLSVDAERHRALTQAAALELGRAIAQRVLGLPTAPR